MVPKKRRDDGTSKDVKASLAKVMAPDKREKLMSERERLMERVRKISKKIGKDKERREEGHGDHKSKKKKKKHKRARVEGEKIDNLVKARQYRPAASADDTAQEEKDKAGPSSSNHDADQDNYVLTKLFKKSGVHSAVSHDAIVEGEGDDYVLVEAEADR